MTRLKIQRKLRGLSQADLGPLVGTHPANISAIERGTRPAWPALRRRIAHFFGIAGVDLFDEHGFAREV